MIACLVLLLSCAGCAGTAGRDSQAASLTDSTSNARPADASRPVRVSSVGADAAEPAIAAAADGTVYVVWVEHRPKREADVWLARFDGGGKSLGPATRVNPTAGEAKSWHGDAPTVGVAPDGAVYVGWTARDGAAGHNSVLHLSASRDGGQTFGTPVKVNDDQKPAVHGMHSLAVAPDGRVHMAWLDERNVAPPPPAPSAAGHKHRESNREVFFASSADGGRTFSPNRRVAAEGCPCCKTSLAAVADGRVYVSWRQVLPGDFRHIAVASSADAGQTFSDPVIVSDDRWMIAGCPVSGAALSPAPGGALRVLWYTAGEAGAPGLYWSESRDGGRTFSARRAFAEGSGRGTPILLADGGDGFVAVWEGGGVTNRPVTARLSGEGRAGDGTVLAGEGELPSAAKAAGQTFVAYVLKEDAGRSIWLAREKAAS